MAHSHGTLFHPLYSPLFNPKSKPKPIFPNPFLLNFTPKKSPNNLSFSIKNSQNTFPSGPTCALLEDPERPEDPEASVSRKRLPQLSIIDSNKYKFKVKFHWGISLNMWWAKIKGAIGQRFNLEGIICAARVLTKDRHLLLPHVSVQDIRYIDWDELRKRGFKGVIFDKDNTLTKPYSLSLYDPLKSSLERCKEVFGESNVAILSNSAGLAEFDPTESKARALERRIGLRVIRHKVKKPAGNAEEIEKQLGCESKEVVMVGDRRFTDAVYGNRNGFLTVFTAPLSGDGEPFVVKVIRNVEDYLVKKWFKSGLKPVNHSLLCDYDVEFVCLNEPFM